MGNTADLFNIREQTVMNTPARRQGCAGRPITGHPTLLGFFTAHLHQGFCVRFYLKIKKKIFFIILFC